MFCMYRLDRGINVPPTPRYRKRHCLQDKARMAGLLRENVRRGDEVSQQLARVQAQLEEVRLQGEQQVNALTSEHRDKLAEVSGK